jgi:type IV pilus assembly protein PilQ
MAPGRPGVAQKTPGLPQAPKDLAVARISPLDASGQAGKGAQTAAAALLTGISTAEENGKVVVTVSTKGPVDYKAFTLSEPRRLVVDFANAGINLPFRELPVNLSVLKQIRIREFSSDGSKVARMVLDLADVKRVNHQIVTEGQTVKILLPAQETKTETQSLKKPAPAPPKPSEPSLPAKSAATSKPAAPKQESPAAKAAAPTKAAASPKPAAVAEAGSTAKTPPTVKPTAAGTTEGPSVRKSKPAATEAAVPPKAPAMSGTPPTPKAEAAKASLPPSGSTQKPATAAAPAAPAKPPRQEQAPPAAEPAARPAPVSKEAAAPGRPQTGVTEARPIEVAELQSAGRAVPLKAPKIEVAPAQVPPTPPQPATPASKAPVQESRFGGTPLTLDLVDIPLVDFFRLMAEEGGINIVMDPQITGTISIKVVKVPWDQILEAALINNGLDKQVEGNLVRIAKRSTLQQEAKQREDLKKATLLAADLETRIKRLNYAKAATFVGALTEQKTVRGTVVVDERSNSLVLTDLPSSVDKMIKLIESLDIPQAQVEIEARIVSANRDFARDLGMQFGFVQGNLQRVTVGGPNTFGSIGGTRPSATPTNTFAAGNGSTGRGASESQSTSSAGVSTGTASQNAGNFNVNLPAGRAFGGLGVSIGNILDTFLLDAAITAGENKGLAKLISQPKVTAQNNSAATITQGLRFPVQIVANNTITVQFQNAALTLVVTPQITLESNIVLDLHVENNTPDFSRSVNGIPSVRTSESTTRVLVSDGGTTVIGGIIIENDTNSSDRVPGAASLPLLGNLFKRTSVSRSTQEVLFFVTPKIVK